MHRIPKVLDKSGSADTVGNALQTLLAWIGAYISLLMISGMQHWFGLPYSIPMLLSTFGPTCALVFGLPTLPASQPLNGIGKIAKFAKFAPSVHRSPYRQLHWCTAMPKLCANVITQWRIAFHK